ncbi:hypothetical protein D3C85_894330 [compost metagenome]
MGGCDYASGGFAAFQDSKVTGRARLRRLHQQPGQRKRRRAGDGGETPPQAQAAQPTTPGLLRNALWRMAEPLRQGAPNRARRRKRRQLIGQRLQMPLPMLDLPLQAGVGTQQALETSPHRRAHGTEHVLSGQTLLHLRILIPHCSRHCLSFSSPRRTQTLTVPVGFFNLSASC